MLTFLSIFNHHKISLLFTYVEKEAQRTVITCRAPHNQAGEKPRGIVKSDSSPNICKYYINLFSGFVPIFRPIVNPQKIWLKVKLYD
jgi:hypothetical protein